MTMKKAVIFDLDGTLLNTLEDLADSLNFALGKHNYPVCTYEQVRGYVGDGAAVLVQRALNGDGESQLYKDVFADFKIHYAKNNNNKTSPYGGIIDLLKQLKQKGLLIAIVSNKPDFAVKSLQEVYFKGIVDCALGQNDNTPKKPAPDMVLKAITNLENISKTVISKDECVYIGDSDVDVMTAKNAQMDMIGVNWGFRGKEFLLAHGAKITVDTAEQLILAIESL